MAGTLNVLLVVVCVTVLWGGPEGVQGVIGVCPAMEECRDEFQQQAEQIGHLREEFCRLVEEEVKCYQRARGSCSAELLSYAQNQIQAAQRQQTAACDASWVKASHWLLTVTAILAVFFHRRF